MHKEAVLDLLQNIYVRKYVASSSIETLTFAIDKELLERTEMGNFILSPKGLDFLKGNIRWENI